MGKEIDIVMQPKGSNLCGQACLAMLLGITLEEAVKKVGRKGKTNTKHLLPHLNSVHTYHFLNSRLWRVTNYRQLPTIGLLKVNFNSKRSHWVVKHKNQIHDPIAGTFYLSDYERAIKGHISSYICLYKIKHATNN